MRKLIVALGLTLSFAALYSCGTGDESSHKPFVPSAWSSPIPKLEMTCGDKECL